MTKDFLQEVKNIIHSEDIVSTIINNFFQVISSIWNYQIFITDSNHKILISNIVISITLFIIGLRVVDYLTSLTKRKLSSIFRDEKVVHSFERLIYYFFMVLMVIFVLDVSNVPLTVFAIIGTAIALGVGLGSQNIVNNFISGIIIIFEKPIKVGDIIETKNVIGRVTNIGARCTSLRTEKNINILIPNSHILQDVIINWTLKDSILKDKISLVVENNATLEKIDETILAVLDNHPNVIKTPVPQILLKELYKTGYQIDIEYWIDLFSSKTKKQVNNDIHRSLIPAFKANKIKTMDRYVNLTVER
jgi:potassium-dependent mechanosensitive channel